MSKVIRFEDTYGMYSAYVAMHRLENELMDLNDSTFYAPSIDAFLMPGLGVDGCFRVYKNLSKMIGFGNIDKIVTVMDIDGANNNGVNSLDSKICSKCLSRFESKVLAIDGNVQFSYVPTIFASETVMLYQHLKREGESFCIENLVHSVNTWKFHSLILAIVNGFEHISEVKNTEKYINIHSMTKAFKEALRLRCTRNDVLIRFMLDKSYEGVNLNKMVSIVDSEYNAFQSRKANVVKFSVQGVEVDNHTLLFKIKDKFRNFPKGYK